MSSAAQHLSPAPALDAFTLSFFDTKRYPMDAASAESYRRHYAEHHYVKFPGLLLGPGFPLLQQEVFRLRECAFRRQFNMECMDNSPRHMSTLGGDGIQELSTLVPRLYEHPALLRFLTYVADVEVQTLPDIDRYVINDLHQSGDTFGAHYDDYPISLVFIIEGAPAGAGGDVEMVKNGALADIDGPRVTRLPLATGDVYMLKSDTTAHRVAPLTADVRRTAINLAYITEGFVVANPTESASLLYKKGYKRR
ncbi:MAG: hypothetical protein ABW123_23815, partial [Cystobacter sp.]